MLGIGLTPLLPDPLEAPIIVTFLEPADRALPICCLPTNCVGESIEIYPGKLAAAKSFRIGCIGAIGKAEIYRDVAAVRKTKVLLEITHMPPL
jgi:2-aminoethylphosphonate-pyruvate transaminase